MINKKNVLIKYIGLNYIDTINKVNSELYEIYNVVNIKNRSADLYKEAYYKVSNFINSLEPLINNINNLKNEFYGINDKIYQEWDNCLQVIGKTTTSIKEQLLEQYTALSM